MHTDFSSRLRQRRGTALLFYIALIPFVILIVGLAVDVTRMYIVQAQLQVAVDGAARGAVRLMQTNARPINNTAEPVTAHSARFRAPAKLHTLRDHDRFV